MPRLGCPQKKAKEQKALSEKCLQQVNFWKNKCNDCLRKLKENGLKLDEEREEANDQMKEVVGPVN